MKSKLLEQIIAAGRLLEQEWPNPIGPTPGSESAVLAPTPLAKLRELQALIRSCASAEAEELRRLAFYADHLTESMTARHLAAQLVPFERLLGRALRDDEFLPLQNDTEEAKGRPGPFRVIVENLRSAFNVGAIFRTAEAFGAEHVVLTGYTPTPEQDKTAKTGMGAQDFISWEHAATTADAIRRSRDDGYSVIALETGPGSIPLDEFEWPEKVALILGNERFGLDPSCLSMVDHMVSIPLAGRKNSLNVGIAFGCAVSHWRQSFDALSPTKASEPHLSRNLEPIGRFHSTTINPYEARRQASRDQSGDIGVIELAKNRGFEQALDGLEGFSKIWLLYDFHHNTEWKPMVMPPRGPRIKRGVFATRSPHRPNGLGLSAVDLVGIEGLKIFIRGFDLLDQTPIYDIKPYLPYADAFPDANAGWTEGLDSQKHEVSFSHGARGKLAWLKSKGVDQIEEFLRSQLEFDPLDEARKRVKIASDASKHHRLSYRTWRADFRFDEAKKEVLVDKIESGYSSEELESSDDPYRDKSVHREFLKNFPGDPGAPLPVETLTSKRSENSNE